MNVYALAVDINGSGGLSTLASSDNWAEIRFDGGAVGHLGEDIELPMETLPMDIDEETDSEVPSEYKPGVGGPGTVTAAACDTLQGFEVLWLWIVFIAEIISLGPAAKPMRQPGMEYVLLSDVNSTAMSRAPGICKMEGGGLPSK